MSDRDAVFHRTKVAASLLDLGGDRHFAVLVHGDAGSGKSTALLRIAREAIRKGYDPYLFREEEGLHVAATTEYLKFNKKAVLFIDDASNQLIAVAKLLKAMKAAGSACRIYLSMRSNRIRGFRLDIPDEFRTDYRLDLDKPDMGDLVARRRASARLGKHVSKTDDWLVAELYKLFNNSLLDSVSYIEFSEGHRARVRRLMVEELADPARKKLIARVACVNRFGFSLPLRAAMTASNLAFKEFSSLVDDSLKTEQALVRDARGLRLRHRILSEYAWTSAFDPTERYEAMSAVVVALAPLVNKSVVKARGIEHLILREVLNRDMVSLALGNDARKFYEVHEDLLGWNSRYWDQRALLESKVYANFPKAYSFSQKAISLERHEFAFTSLGSICLDHAGELAKTNIDEAMTIFAEGNDALTTAYNIAEQEGRSHEHPFVTFFASATWLLRNMRHAVPATEAVFQLYDIWIQRAQAAPVFANTYGKKRLDQIRATRMKEELRLRRGA